MSSFFGFFSRYCKAATTQPHTPTSTVETPFEYSDRSVDEPRPIKVAVIGAGYSGLLAAIRLSQRVRNVDLTVYEASDGVGGTWHLNQYPGLACDIPSHAYQFTFESKRDWSAYYAPGPEIRQYLEGIAERYNVLPYIEFRHRLVHARFSVPSSKWTLMMQRPVSTDASSGTGLAEQTAMEDFEVEADVVLTGIGVLNRWSWPDIAGLQDFKGNIIHSAQWDTGEGDVSLGWEDTVKTWGDKKVAVIGVGASALQIVPALQPKVGKLFNYVRGKTWIGVPFVGNMLAALSKSSPDKNYHFTEEDKAKFQDDEFYRQFRRELEDELNSAHKFTINNTEESKQGRELFERIMRQKLEKRPWIADYIIPDFPVGARRLTPAPGYLEAVCEDNVEFKTTPITRITPTGIETSDGQHQELDVIICATGFDVSFQLPFPVIGRNNLTLNEANTPHPRTYLSMATAGFPNWLHLLGPNSGVGAGSLLIMIEKMTDYAVEVVLKMQRENIKSMEPTKEAVDEFDEYLDAYFTRTVFSAKCKSWYKMGKEEGRIVGMWPGSPLHAVKTFSHPRWEDYKYTYHTPSGSRANRFAFLGNGETYNERIGNGDLAWYLRDVDYPPRLPDPPDPAEAPIS
ncbi:FAD/NAD(P)-binding domain-containing protein [Pterulicium gracile]|uniref:FAD/NAD(P)-binding domain-containing protein n=1 Tax=Pterulicium gracile TaxID=1884261 RepID=A0A5C3QN89_9AGAR|nr:FAD/NAD(P)-binding domain-containing protein [Pterula gracilis]